MSTLGVDTHLKEGLGWEPVEIETLRRVLNDRISQESCHFYKRKKFTRGHSSPFLGEAHYPFSLTTAEYS